MGKLTVKSDFINPRASQGILSLSNHPCAQKALGILRYTKEVLISGPCP